MKMTNKKGNLETRTKDRVPSKLSGNCPTCKKDTIFNYIGQTTFPKAEPLETYNCRECKGTFTLYTLTNRYDAKFKSEDLIDAHSAKRSLLNSLKKSLIKAIYSI